MSPGHRTPTGWWASARQWALRHVRPARLYVDSPFGNYPERHDNRILLQHGGLRRPIRLCWRARLPADPGGQLYDLRPARLHKHAGRLYIYERGNSGGILQYVRMRPRLCAGSRRSLYDLRFAGGPGRHRQRILYSWRAASGHQPGRGDCGDLLSDPSGGEHGFLRAKSGAFTTIDVPDASFTEVLAINPFGAVVGDFCGPATCYVGFIRSPHGNFTTINTPGSVACGEGAIALGINPAGAVTGLTTDITCSLSLGYLRTPDGTITTFGVTGAFSFEPMAINPAALITGWFFDNSGAHGFLRTLDGAIIPFDVPGASSTFATEISATGAIIGIHYDANGLQHGFLRLPW